MRIKIVPADFQVNEELNLKLGTRGDYAIYEVTKQGITTEKAQQALARVAGCHPRAVRFPARKDRQAVAVQFASIKGNPPQRLVSEQVSATHAGRLDRPLQPTDIGANRFAITLRDLSPSEAKALGDQLTRMAEHGLPNYFHHQRFGSYSLGDGFLGARIVARDAEGALRAYLARVYPGDPGAVRRFKRVAADRWGEWDTLFAAAPQPSNYRSLLTFLRDHPTAYRKALNLIPRRTLSLYLAAYQSHLWNLIAGNSLETLLGEPTARVEIAGTALPIYDRLPADLRGRLEALSISMPYHRAQYDDPVLQEVVARVLAAEGLTQNDLKARILKRAYLSRHQRRLLLYPTELSLETPVQDERFVGRVKVLAAFTLPRGSYATLLLEAAGAFCDG